MDKLYLNIPIHNIMHIYILKHIVLHIRRSFKAVFYRHILLRSSISLQDIDQYCIIKLTRNVSRKKKF